MEYTYIYASILHVSGTLHFSVFQADIEPENQLYPTRSIDVDYQHITPFLRSLYVRWTRLLYV